MTAAELRGDRPALRRALTLLGAAELAFGALPLPTRPSRAAELAREDGDDLLVARAANNLGLIANIRGAEGRGGGALPAGDPGLPASGQRAGAGGVPSQHGDQLPQHRLERPTRPRRRSYAREARDARLEAVARLGRAELSLRRGDAALAEAGARVASDFGALGDPVPQADAALAAWPACASGAQPPASCWTRRSTPPARTARRSTRRRRCGRAPSFATLGDSAAGRSDAVEAAAVFGRLRGGAGDGRRRSGGRRR